VEPKDRLRGLCVACQQAIAMAPRETGRGLLCSKLLLGKNVEGTTRNFANNLQAIEESPSGWNQQGDFFFP